ncbi:sterol desaturase family protein [Paenibacillus hodogayensis]|uniref:Sterol desaturase family protein n=1 Tax=Paenibacillus hodogayensis TaxID=279208 RepID=A0ABV5W5E8_9BACL
MRSHLKEFCKDGRVLFIGIMWIVYASVAMATGWNGRTWAWVGAGIAIFFFVEYFVHRFVLHGVLCRWMPKAHQGHDDHHAHPTEMRHLLTPNSYNVPTHFALWLVCSASTASVHAGSAVMMGVAALHMYYEWTHFVSHRPIAPRTRWGKWMKKYHLLHHYKSPDSWYGVTNPALDKLFGTEGQVRGKDAGNKEGTFRS